MADIRQAIYLTVHQYPGRGKLSHVESAALVLGKAPGTLYNKADPGNDQQGLLVEEAVALMLSADDYRILRAMAAVCDHAVVRLTQFRNVSDLELLDLLVKEQEAAGRKAMTIGAALADGRIDQEELRDITRAFHAQIHATLELLSRLENLAGVARKV